MTVWLVRHATAGDRSRWTGSDRLRPVDERGQKQAHALAGLLEGEVFARVLSSPYLRCVQTVEPLAARRGLTVEEHASLAEGAGAEAVPLLRDLAAGGAVVCTHGDVVPALLDAIAAEDGVAIPAGAECEKGSAWVLDADGRRFRRARYLPPGA